jgi:hypothetical protein
MKRPVLTVTAAALLTCAAFPAFALQIFVSNEKDNTVMRIAIQHLPSATARPSK